MLDKLKVAVVLVVIGAVAGLLIYGTNALTEEPIEINLLEQEENYYKEIFSLDETTEIDVVKHDLDGDLEQEIIIRDTLGNVIGTIYKGSERNSYGDITVLVGIAVDGTIANVIIASTTNTPTFVKNIEKNYLPNFVGRDSSDVTFDAKTGASFTYGSVQGFVEAATAYYQANGGDAS